MLTLLHFADSHIDIAGHGRHDPASGLPVRVLDFLKALDTIVDTAITEKVDLVIFAGDAYKDRTPVPTFQREWGKRIIRLSQAGIQTLLLVGNHDLSPAAGRAHALQEFETLQIPNIHVASKPSFWKPEDLGGLPVQIIALPWVSRSSFMATMELSAAKPEEIHKQIEERLHELVQMWLENADPALPVILAAHASVQGAVFGSERSVMLGADMVLPGGLVRDTRLSYVALGHIHKAQNLNENSQPPVIYPGSIERVDFGEAADDKYYVLARLEKGKDTQVEWRKLNGRRFLDLRKKITSATAFQAEALSALPEADALQDAIVRLTLEYNRAWEVMLDEPALRRRAENAFEFHLLRRPQMETRLRLPDQ
ncbi:MAG TPA: exonuclease SbcCD subunit D, partial [Anaerolineaceae bacterium]|nr:exonuclease SbcCD subunit D [Anaerolineaceae bacterium]